jgi:hypothetical protein
VFQQLRHRCAADIHDAPNRDIETNLHDYYCQLDGTTAGISLERPDWDTTGPVVPAAPPNICSDQSYNRLERLNR